VKLVSKKWKTLIVEQRSKVSKNRIDILYCDVYILKNKKKEICKKKLIFWKKEKKNDYKKKFVNSYVIRIL
jgi:hypothetical protein